MKRLSALLSAAQPGEHPAARGFTRWLEEHGHDWQSFDRADRYELWLVFVDECIAEAFAAAEAERKRQRRSDRLDGLMWLVVFAAWVGVVVQAVVTLGGGW